MPYSRIYLTRPGGGLRPFYRIRVNGKLHYLGTDIDAAERRAARLIAKLPIATEPRTVAGLIDVWTIKHPDYKTTEYLKAWQESLGTLKLRDLHQDHLDDYLAYLKRRFRRWSTPKVKPKDWMPPPRVKLSPSTIRKYVGIAYTVCVWGRKRQFLNVAVDRPHGVPTQRRTRHDLRPGGDRQGLRHAASASLGHPRVHLCDRLPTRRSPCVAVVPSQPRAQALHYRIPQDGSGHGTG